ncbi:MAG: HlyD family efflux transporter periplasmic adaptor subunit [Planctomycetales bacterium]|nr:HlyD family efflux transporter periplasmic adaptor subunit [Planctomycetales bacterium]
MSNAVLMAVLVISGPQDLGRQSDWIEVEQAIVKAKDDRWVPALDAAVISELLVREGVYVQQGQLLARQDDQDLLAQRAARVGELDLAREQAKSEAEEKAAWETYLTSKIEYEESLTINKQEPGAVPATQVRRQELQMNRAKLQAVVAREQRRIAIMQTYVKAREVEIADVAIKHRRIVSPIAGEITQILLRTGEWAQPGERLMRVLRMDVLRVEGSVYAVDAAPYEVKGRHVKVLVSTPQGDVETEGTIVFADPNYTGVKQKFRVVAEINNVAHGSIPNTWLINSGMPATLRISRTQAGAPMDPDPLPAAPGLPPVDPGVPGVPPAPANPLLGQPPLDVLPGLGAP